MEQIQKPKLTESEAQQINNEAADRAIRAEQDRRAKIASEAGKAAVEDADKVIDDIDAVLDDIDEVLESNAEEFVQGYVQKGGE